LKFFFYYISYKINKKIMTTILPAYYLTCSSCFKVSGIMTGGINCDILTKMITKDQCRYCSNKTHCKVNGCKKNHKSHLCRICNNPDSTHASCNCASICVKCQYTFVDYANKYCKSCVMATYLK
jgi:hypothetical protein